ncbi:Ig-like domain-containing protein [Aeromicrobium wangtongii]|uniref:Ig-like domain-containing protein n=1 Tax=Aeromicrobium wangtongii TaxID=2969247 RepID=A0ABY5M872_9ACTN|nr:cadherin-like domain-containing protein [Aeromicrobium wangtongii]MCD9199681.1 Ig-like domain-containing protein [Aeromicrobium wangtongii]UUP14032.1 Ig-like domain-containing protein [Aeromicrobium wangtongii]
MNHTSTRRRAGAGVAIGALAASALIFTPSAQAATTADVRESQIAPNASTYAGWHQGVDNAAADAARVVNEGLQLKGRSQVIKGYADNDNTVGSNKNFDLSTIENAAAYTVKSGTASLQIPVFVDLDGAGPDAAVFTTLRTPLGSGSEVKLSDNWEVSRAFGSIPANTPTPLSDIVAALGSTYKVIAFGVYNESGTSVVSDITFDGTKYLFANSAPVIKDQKVSTKMNTAVTLPLTATDVDGNELAYTITGVVGGSVTGSGAKQTFTPTKNFKGAASVKYTVDDSRGGTASATISIQVAKQKGKVELYRIHPAGKVSIRNTVSLYAKVTIEGKQADRGMTVYGYAKGKKVVTGKINSYGKVKLTLPDKLPAGNATLKVTLVGSSTRIGDSDSIKVKVKK